MQTQETLTNQYKCHNRSRNTSKIKLIKHSTTESSSSSSSSSSSENSSDKSSSSSSSYSSGCQFIYEIGEKLDKYVVTKYLSSGTFGMVLEVTDELGLPYAVKILSQTDHTEVEVLKQIQQFDPFGEAGIVRFYDYFAWQDYHCILLERLGLNLHDYLQQHSLNITEIQSIFQQITNSVLFMHSLGITHTDLKPENIVFSHQQKYTQVNDQRNLVKLIDMGGATQANEHHSTVINTRYYRAPEVILRCDAWDTSSDIWSLACLIVELYTGSVFIKVGNNDLMHLAIIQSIFGPIPRWMKERSKIKTKLNSLPKPQPQQQLNQLIKDKDLLDLLTKMFCIDHNQRIDCNQILLHNFFQKKFI